MNLQLTFHEKIMAINLTDQAIRQSKQLNDKLLIEIQIYFGCLLGKRLAFYSDTDMNGAWRVDKKLFSAMVDDAEQLTEKIYVRFNTS